MLRKTYINVDSLNESNPSKFSINLENQLNNVKKVYIRSYEIPVSFYSINSSNNTIDFEDSVPNSYSATITPGNYTPSELASELQTQMSAEYSSTTVSYDSNTYKLTFTNSSSNIKILDSSTISSIIGLDGDSSLSSSVEMSNVVNLNGNNYLFLKSHILFSGSGSLMKNNNTTRDYVRIPVNANSGGVIMFSDLTLCFEYLSNVSFKKLDFELLDSSENQLDLNGLGLSLELLIYHEN